MAVSYAGNVRVRDSSVLGDLTEKVLAVYRLKPATEQRLELQPKTIKFGVLAINSPIDHIFSRMVFEIAKAFRNPIKRTRTSYDKFRLIEHYHRRVI